MEAPPSTLRGRQAARNPRAVGGEGHVIAKVILGRVLQPRLQPPVLDPQQALLAAPNGLSAESKSAVLLGLTAIVKMSVALVAWKMVKAASTRLKIPSCVWPWSRPLSWHSPVSLMM